MCRGDRQQHHAESLGADALGGDALAIGESLLAFVGRTRAQVGAVVDMVDSLTDRLIRWFSIDPPREASPRNERFLVAAQPLGMKGLTPQLHGTALLH